MPAVPEKDPKMREQCVPQMAAHSPEYPSLAAEPDSAADIRFRFMHPVREKRTFPVPVQVPKTRRGEMPTVSESDRTRPVRVERLISVLWFRLDRPPARPYFLQESVVSREWIRVDPRFQFTRWRASRVPAWFSVRRHTGRGEGSIGLTFDGFRVNAVTRHALVARSR